MTFPGHISYRNDAAVLIVFCVDQAHWIEVEKLSSKEKYGLFLSPLEIQYESQQPYSSTHMTR